MLKAGRALSLTTAAGFLVDGCFAGHDAAWRELHRIYYPVVRSFLRRMGVVATKMDDACQEVFVQLLRYLSGFERREELKTSVYRACLKQLHRRPPRVLRPAPKGPATPADAGQQSSQEEMQRRVAEALGALKVPSREVFVLYELEELSGEQIGRILDCPEATVWRRLRQARKEFEALVAGPGKKGP
jgi:RNA polymerase sigma-70 factor (ECF subfamily)